MKMYFLGIDNGGTVTKAAIVDSEGREIALASRKVPMILPQPGFTERDMILLWQANCDVIREVIAQAGIGAGEIRGIACTGHGKGLYLWGRDGKPAYNGIISTDSRAWSYPEGWEKDGTAARVHEKTYQRILACQPVSILRWFKDNRPEVLKNTQWIFEVKDYVRFMLTGEAFAEITDYSGSSLMNLREARFDRELLNEFGLGDLMDRLPPIRYSTEHCGSISAAAAAATGLREGTPVAGGMFDIDACAVAMDVTDEEYLCVIAGTWSINEYVSRAPVLNKSIMMNSLFCLPGYYLIEECSPTSAGNYEWFKELFLETEIKEARERGISFYALAEEMAAGIGPGDQDIVFLPYIFGSNYNPQARACFVGLTGAHTRAQLIRSVLEGIVFCHMVHVEKLLANRPRPSAVRLAGGAANSKTWVRIFADVFQLPIEIVDVAELGTLGCAMAAAVASGVYADLKDAAKHMVKIKYRVEPDAGNAAIYAKKYARYRKVSEALDGLWQDFSYHSSP
ncbi:MAG: FGGY-family carbohydrate kinase [Rectinemataceae bacterium]|jgi:L-xylulokinase